MKAIGYARWSSMEQGKGQTLERQRKLIRDFCASRGWQLVDEVADEGTSGYTGANIHTGNLARLITGVEQGNISRDTVLVVEQLDRISRLPPSQAVAWINRAVGLGLSIATVNDGMVIDRAMIDANPMNFMSIVFNAFRAFQESKHKSERLSQSWTLKRQRLERGEVVPLTSVCPAWLRLNPSSQRFEVIPERAAIVREIFARTLDGDGKAAIAASLNARGVEPWGRGGSKADGWHQSYIHKILRSPTVVGEFQPHTKARGDERRTPAGDPVQGYYPAVVSEEDWARVRAIKPIKPGGNGFRGEYRNLFSGLCRCQSCGGVMTYQFKNDDGFRMRGTKRVAQKRMSYLLCANRVRKLGCTNSAFYRYEDLEDGLLDGVLSAALRDAFFTDRVGVAALSEDAYRLGRQLEAERAKVARLLDLFADTGDADVRQRWTTAKAGLSQLEADVDVATANLQVAQGRASPDQHAERVAAVREQLADADLEVRRDARLRVMQSLRELIDRIEFNEVGDISMVLTGGGHAIRFARDGSIRGDVQVGPASRISDPVAQAAALDVLDHL